MIGIGVDRVILGTSAAQDAAITQGVLDLFRDQVIVGIDAKDANLRRLWDTVAAAPEERFVPAVFAIFTYCTTGQ